MKIGVVSDSHGDLYAVEKAIKKMGDVDIIVHLGDYCRDAAVISKRLKLDIVYIKGNCDFSASVESEKILEIEGKRILLTHGDRYGVKYDYGAIYYAAKDRGVDAVMFGHTHFADIFEEEGIYFINPGSVSKPRNGIETYAVVNIKDGRIEPSIVQLC